MEEFDPHTEHAHEQAQEAAHESHEKWIMGVALTAAILAALAAVTSMLSGHNEHEAMMLQMKSVDQWNYYQAKSLKKLIREEQIANLELAGEKVPDKLRTKVDEAASEQTPIRAKAEGFEKFGEFHDHLHMIFAYGVTLFQVAIAVSAISALTRRREFWLVGLALGTLALGFLAAGGLVACGVVGNHAPNPESSVIEGAK